MPALGLGHEQIDKLTFYLLSLREVDLPDQFRPKDRILVERFGGREFAGDGATLYTTFCTACHGPKGEGRRFPDFTPFPSVANADFLAVVDDAFLAETIRNGRVGRRMPAWNENEGGLREQEIARIVEHLRDLGGVSEVEVETTPHRWVQADPKTGQRLFLAHCAGCHGAQGEGVDAPQLNNKSLLAAAGDTYFVETVSRGRGGTAMPGFSRPSPAYPVLSDSDIKSIVAFIRTWEEPSK
jgi:cytochrome c oxidase cbb3-type subunit 3